MKFLPRNKTLPSQLFNKALAYPGPLLLNRKIYL